VLPEATPAASGELLIGVRPEDVAIGQGDLKFDIVIIEELGAHRLLHGRLGEQPFLVSVNKDDKTTVDTVPVAIKQDAVHFFAVEGGRRL